MAIRWDNKILLLKVETTPGTDAVPTGAANAVLATNIELSPMEGQDLSRDLERAFLGGQPTIPVDLHTKLKFRVEAEPSGSLATAPAWGPALRSGGVSQVINAGTNVVYNPISDGFQGVTIHMWVGDTRYVLLAAKSNVQFKLDASGIPYYEFDYTGIWTLPTDQARPVVDVSVYKDPKPATKANTPTFTVNGVSLVMRSFTLNFGNDVKPSFLINEESIIVARKAESVQFQVRAVPLGTFNPYLLAANQTQVAVQLIHGTTAGRKIQLDIPRLQLQRPASLANQDNQVEWPLSGVPIPSGAGNDQFTFTLN